MSYPELKCTFGVVISVYSSYNKKKVSSLYVTLLRNCNEKTLQCKKKCINPGLKVCITCLAHYQPSHQMWCKSVLPLQICWKTDSQKGRQHYLHGGGLNISALCLMTMGCSVSYRSPEVKRTGTLRLRQSPCPEPFHHPANVKVMDFCCWRFCYFCC